MRAPIRLASIALSFLTLSSSVLFAQDKITLPNVKEGLWEVTLSHTSSGLPAGIPPEALAKMTPEQRAQVEAMMKQKGMSSNGNTTVVKNCVTKQKIAEGMAFAQNRENCTHSLVNSSSVRYEYKIHCDENKNGKKTTIDGTTVVDVLGSDSVKGTSHVSMNTDGHPMTMDSTFTSKYLGADCGDIK
jgi:hypothetical protein